MEEHFECGFWIADYNGSLQTDYSAHPAPDPIPHRLCQVNL